MKQRPLIKTLTFAVLHFATAFIVVYALTGSLVLGGAVALIEPLCNTLVFYLHERAWQRFGRRKAERSHSYGHDVFLEYMGGGQATESRIARSQR
ncbi:DUF2061 domain-containing protein [Pseudomonas stutzeri]|uniref:DUF2061 domain-containing protein n=1 Tax=Stutzerimonas stutzeri TaxID=316 RepID=UPI001909B73F|nr:DUF2061 domain-containing protein [Stutzerimonas stutzeri]MBK3867327.1 DUF2061 domain-containing protein [Stutzerimonas stutzeri]